MTEQAFCKTFDLDSYKSFQPKRIMAPHQQKSMKSLNEWFQQKESKNGALLVIPTGGGKTFAAVRFLCKNPLSQDYKVLWLAHTHHLLEQAFYTFVPETEKERKKYGVEIANVQRKSGKLKIRVVSGEPIHSQLADVETTDDVLICTLQTVAKGIKSHQKKLLAFLNSTSNLFIVFDEAHHTPADTYRKTMQELQGLKGKTVFSLGLTATPHHSDDNKRNWFLKIYPQGIIPQPVITVSELIADGILSKVKVLDPLTTDYTPKFSESEYQKWIDEFHDDIPPKVINLMADSIERNKTIANTYDKQKFGKTIIFADRWFQCEAICKLLEKRNVRAGAIYSHSTNHSTNYGMLKQRERSQMDKDLDEFKNPEGKLDVLVNINILTEGTDVPSVKSVFITRQTTSEIKLRQMVGRALRGPKFNGTSEANVVLFIDNWKIGDIVGEFAALPNDIPFETEQGKHEYHVPIPISLDLIRRLTDLQDQNFDSMPITFDELFPVGWYETIVESLAGKDSDDILQNRRLILIFKHEQENYQDAIQYMKKQDISEFLDLEVSLDQMKPKLTNWSARFFHEPRAVSGDIERNLFYLAKHLTINDDIPFYPLEDRELHKMDDIARAHLENKVDRPTGIMLLKEEYSREDRYWKTLYPDYGKFRYHYDLVMNKLSDDLVEIDHDSIPDGKAVDIFPKESDVSDEIKRAVRKRDGNKCVCCGETKHLDVDHIITKYSDKNHDISNLQTLCKVCHKIKSKFDNSTEFVFNFRQTSNPDEIFEIPFDIFKTPVDNDKDEWTKFMRRYFNFLYRAQSIDKMIILARNYHFYNWEFSFLKGIDKKIGKQKLEGLMEYINSIKPKKIISLKITA